MLLTRGSRRTKLQATPPGTASYQRTGVLSGAEFARRCAQPSQERLAAGPVVMVECIERIPCNPCASACPRRAITIEGGLTGIPKVDYAKCNGCALCIPKCPGLAIFVVNRDYSAVEATVAIPYELLPRPRPGERVALLDRAGRAVGKGRVLKVLDSPALNRCAVVTVTTPRRFWNTVRSIRLAPGRRT